MNSHVLIVQGHPDCTRGHLCHALADAYADGARAGGHLVDTIEPARLGLPLLGSQQEWQARPVPPEVLAAQEAIRRARHLVFVYPLWLGGMPAPV